MGGGGGGLCRMVMRATYVATTCKIEILMKLYKIQSKAFRRAARMI